MLSLIITLSKTFFDILVYFLIKAYDALKNNFVALDQHQDGD